MGKRGKVRYLREDFEANSLNLSLRKEVRDKSFLQNGLEDQQSSVTL